MDFEAYVVGKWRDMEAGLERTELGVSESHC